MSIPALIFAAAVSAAQPVGGQSTAGCGAHQPQLIEAQANKLCYNRIRTRCYWKNGKQACYQVVVKVCRTYPQPFNPTRVR